MPNKHLLSESADEEDASHVPRVAFLTLGETPRIDVVPDVLKYLDADVCPIEYGLLDKIGPSALVGPGLQGQDDCLITRLSSGSNILLSRRWADHRLSEIADEALNDGAEYVVLLSTGGVVPRMNPLCITVQGQKEINRTIDSMRAASLSVGTVYALEEQLVEVCSHGLISPATCAAAYPEDEEALFKAAIKLADCDLVVLHSVRCCDAEAQLVKSVTGKPVVLARQVIANTLNRTIHNTLSKSQGNGEARNLLIKLRLLSRRERDVIPYVAEGLSNKEISRVLGISHRTVEIHRARAKEKLELVSWVPLVRVLASINGNDYG